MNKKANPRPHIRIIILNWNWETDVVPCNFLEKSKQPISFKPEAHQPASSGKGSLLNKEWLKQELKSKWDRSIMEIIDQKNDFVFKMSFNLKQILDDDAQDESRLLVKHFCEELTAQMPKHSQFHVLFLYHKGFEIPNKIMKTKASQKIKEKDFFVKYHPFAGGGVFGSQTRILYGEKGFLSNTHGRFYKGVEKDGRLPEQNFENVWRAFTYQTRSKIEDLYDALTAHMVVAHLSDESSEAPAKELNKALLNEFVAASKGTLKRPSSNAKASFSSSWDLPELMGRHPDLLAALEKIKDNQKIDISTIREGMTKLLQDPYLV